MKTCHRYANWLNLIELGGLSKILVDLNQFRKVGRDLLSILLSVSLEFPWIRVYRKNPGIASLNQHLNKKIDSI